MLHAVRLLVSPERADDPESAPTPTGDYPEILRPRMEQHVLAEFEEELAEEATEIGLIYADEDSGRPEHVRGIYRFSLADTKSNLVDAIESGVVGDAEWWRIDYHQCDRDEPASRRTGCPGWVVEAFAGDVPEHL